MLRLYWFPVRNWAHQLTGLIPHPMCHPGRIPPDATASICRHAGCGVAIATLASGSPHTMHVRPLLASNRQVMNEKASQPFKIWAMCNSGLLRLWHFYLVVWLVTVLEMSIAFLKWLPGSGGAAYIHVLRLSLSLPCCYAALGKCSGWRISEVQNDPGSGTFPVSVGFWLLL